MPPGRPGCEKSAPVPLRIISAILSHEAASPVSARHVASCGCSGCTKRRASARPCLSLIEAERESARTSVGQGMRRPFLAFFAEDGIDHQRYPVQIRAAIMSQPIPVEPFSTALNRKPVYADIALAGNFL